MNSINAIEASLLSDLLALYLDDLSREIHTALHESCLACSKERLIAAIAQHQKLNEKLHVPRDI